MTSPLDHTIQYPFETPPEAGSMREMAPGLFWIRLPLPIALNHVNVWVLDDGDGWTIVDCGLATDESMQIWDALAVGALSGKPVRRFVATHGHPDHMGASRALLRRFDMGFAATRLEWETAVQRRAEGESDVGPEQAAFLVAHGYPAERSTTRTSFGKIIMPLLADPPALDEDLQDGGVLRMGQRDWRIMIAGGHAAGHASFYCAADRILIAGDQILPRITPFVGVDFREPDADPLKIYLDSMALFGGLAPETLVLPGHGLPFRGLPHRLEQMHRHHAERLGTLADGLDRPRQAFDLAALLFPKAIGTGHERMALAETLAHLHRLTADGRAIRERTGDGGWRFRRD